MTFFKSNKSGENFFNNLLLNQVLQGEINQTSDMKLTFVQVLWWCVCTVEI